MIMENRNGAHCYIFLFFCRSVSLSDKTKMGAANTILPIIINSVGTHTNIVS